MTKELLRLVWLIAFLLVPGWLTAQNDTIPLTLSSLMDQVLDFHPVAKQAGLLSENARQELRLARGGFDPKLTSDYDQKVFKDKNYFEIWKTELKVPTWLVDVKAGYEQNTGTNLSREKDTDGGNGLAYAGVMLPVGQGMFIDYRRATLEKAKIFQELTKAEQNKILNKLILQVAKDYWEWYFAWHKFRLSRRGFNLASFRYNAVVQEVEQGNLAPIDTVEAKITIQQREIDLKQAEVDFRNARITLSNHLWMENNQPVELAENMIPAEEIPPIFSMDELESLRTFAMQNHPEILKTRFKLDQLDVDRRLAAENLKPTLDVDYKFLLRRPVSGNEFGNTLFTENYKIGVNFSLPLFLRKERAKLQQVKVKINQSQLMLLDIERNTINQINKFYNDATNLQQLLLMQSEMAQNYETLYRGEIQKFREGVSSVFYVNVREGKMLEAQIKLFSMRMKYAKSLAELRWSAGMGWE